MPDFSCLLCYARSMAGGYTTENREGIYFLVTKLSDLKDKFLPTLLSLEYPVVGYKYIDFLYFKEAIEIMDKKLHFAYGTSSEEGLNKLRKIRQLLNSGPDYVVLPPASYGRRKDWLLLLTKYGSPPAVGGRKEGSRPIKKTDGSLFMALLSPLFKYIPGKARRSTLDSLIFYVLPTLTVFTDIVNRFFWLLLLLLPAILLA